MATFVYRCPNMGLNVQGWVADDPTEGDAETYQPIPCTICTRLHLVDSIECSGMTTIKPRR
jgi:hypothetical protein